MSQPAQRRQKLLRQFRKASIDALLVTNVQNVTYLSGFTGDDSCLLLSPADTFLISDFRYEQQIHEECPGLEVKIRSAGVKMADTVADLTTSLKLRRLGIEAGSMTVSARDELAAKLDQVELVSTSDLVETLRMVKDREEVDAIRRAIWQAEKAFAVTRAWLTPELTETQVAAELEYQMRRFGARGVSFDPIVATGARAALPHATPTSQCIGDASFTLFDWGADEGLYRSDLTRLVITGKISPKLEHIYGVVLKAQLAAIDAIRPGVTCREVDDVARKIIANSGHGKHFGHGLGHGIGLDIHEGPRLGKSSDTQLKPQMVITVEPGIYLPGWGGVRIEDDVLVTRDGCEVLTSVPKQLETCVTPLCA